MGNRNKGLRTPFIENRKTLPNPAARADQVQSIQQRVRAHKALSAQKTVDLSKIACMQEIIEKNLVEQTLELENELLEEEEELEAAEDIIEDWLQDEEINADDWETEVTDFLNASSIHKSVHHMHKDKVEPEKLKSEQQMQEQVEPEQPEPRQQMQEQVAPEQSEPRQQMQEQVAPEQPEPRQQMQEPMELEQPEPEQQMQPMESEPIANDEATKEDSGTPQEELDFVKMDEMHSRVRSIEIIRGIRIAAIICLTLIIAAAAGIAVALYENGAGWNDFVLAMEQKKSPDTMMEDHETAETAMAEQETEIEKEQTTGVISENQISDNLLNATQSQESFQTANQASGNQVAGATVSDAQISDNQIAENQNYADAQASVSGDSLQAHAEALAGMATFQLVDESYFNDALFIGDSRLEGFGMHSGLNATFYCATGLQLHKIETSKVVRTPNGRIPIFDAIQPGIYKKIYIKVGLNELGWGTDELFLENYANLIARLRELEPDAIIYVHGLIHVTADKSMNDKTHTNEKIDQRNALLAQFAAAQGAYYLDLNEVVCGTDGALIPDMTSDGIHLKAKYMELWKNYLMAHAIVP